MKICVQDGGLREYVGSEACYSLLAETGFEAIDWNIDQALSPARIRGLDYLGDCIFEKSLEEVIAYYQPQIDLIKKNGMTISQAHAPFPAYVPGHPEVLEHMIGIYKRCIELCDYAGCKNLVIHGINLAENDKENTPESIEALNWHLYESLIPTLQKCNVVVCLENLFSWDAAAVEGVCSNPYEAVRYIDTLNEKAGKEAFGFCLDTGHLQLLGKGLRSYMPVLGKRIKCLHVHDNDGRVDRHLAPFTGKVNWNYFCDMLKQIGYEGDLSFETFQQCNVARKFDEEMVKPWLVLIRQIGELFRKRILG